MVGQMQNRGLSLWMAVLAGMQMLTAGSQLAGLIGQKWAGGAALLVAALMTGTTAWIAAQPKPAQSYQVQVPLQVQVPGLAQLQQFSDSTGNPLPDLFKDDPNG